MSTPVSLDAVYRMFDRQRDELAALLQAEDTSDLRAVPSGSPW